MNGFTTSAILGSGASTAITTGGVSQIYIVGGGHIQESTNRDVLQTPAGTQAIVKTRPEISPKLYFKFVKSKLSNSNQKELGKRLNKLKSLYDDAKLVGQDGLADHLLKQLAISLREQEASVCGYGRFVTIQHIEKFKHIVKDRTIGWGKLENFPRPIPKDIQEQIKVCKDKAVFDEYWVLYFNPEKIPEAKTNEQKIIEKDPILFGRFAYDESRYFYVCDWIDEYCDLTLDKFISTMNSDSDLKKSYDLDEISELNWRDIERIKDEVLASHDRLKNTNRGNFQALAVQERESKAVKRPWWKIFGEKK